MLSISFKYSTLFSFLDPEKRESLILPLQVQREVDQGSCAPKSEFLLNPFSSPKFSRAGLSPPTRTTRKSWRIIESNDVAMESGISFAVCWGGGQDGEGEESKEEKGTERRKRSLRE